MSGTEHKRQRSNGEPADRAVVIGMSAGGLSALRELVCALASPFPAAVIVAQHAGSLALTELMSSWTPHKVVVAASGQQLQNGVFYVCPTQSHIVVNADATLAVSTKPRIRFVRPSLDWLLESVAAVYEDRAVAVLLSGANDDGTRGARLIARAGGTVVVQDPHTCQFPEMPLSAIREGHAHSWLAPAEIAALLMDCMGSSQSRLPNAWKHPFAAE